ncbi:DUF3119 family protein [Microcoleus sp. ARI1-B5]|uniref:DUF3119 family protein n=1 Tax=unclassified Microcoleus TaxID=2642155 RepID=UPI002FD0552B
MNTTASATSPTNTIELAPSYAIPLVLVLAAVPLLFVQKWASLSVSLFGLFLMYQAATLRLQFTPTDLDIYRSSNLIRRFAYREWLNWRIFWPAVPILFYFKEINSIHFLPVLFDRKMLQTCLEQRCPRQD